MIEQSLSNTNEKYYNTFSKSFCKLNMTPMSVFCAGACPCAICQSQRLASSAMCLLRFPQLFSSGNEGDVEANPKFNSLALHSRSIFLK
jgi:hypothetical protein